MRTPSRGLDIGQDIKLERSNDPVANLSLPARLLRPDRRTGLNNLQPLCISFPSSQALTNILLTEPLPEHSRHVALQPHHLLDLSEGLTKHVDYIEDQTTVEDEGSGVCPSLLPALH